MYGCPENTLGITSRNVLGTYPEPTPNLPRTYSEPTPKLLQSRRQPAANLGILYSISTRTLLGYHYSTQRADPKEWSRASSVNTQTAFPPNIDIMSVLVSMFTSQLSRHYIGIIVGMTTGTNSCLATLHCFCPSYGKLSRKNSGLMISLSIVVRMRILACPACI